MTSPKTLAAAAALLVLVASCGVPTDESAQIIEQDQLAVELQKATTTTTTTTTPVVAFDVDFYLLRQVADTEQNRVVVSVVIPQPDSNDFAELIAPMFDADFATSASELAGEELTNSLAEYNLLDITVADGVATVFLDTEAEDPPDDPVLTDAAAQLVWTLSTTFRDLDSMLINFRGEPLPLPTDVTSGVTTSVTTADYELYAPNE